MNRIFLAGTALCAALSLPALAEAASGFSTANVNVRSGPSTAYPAVTLIPVGQTLRINGCLAETPWCDVSFPGGRGWVAGRYIQATYQQRRIYVGPEYYRPLGIPTVVFNLDSYWDRNYRGRDFYRDRDRWSRGPDWDRNDGDQNWGRRRPPPPPPPSVYDQQDDNYQGNWRRQPGYGRQGYDNDYSQDGDNRPPPPRYRQPYNDDQQYRNPPPPGNFQGNNPQRPPRQQDQSQQRPQPPVQTQPAPQPPPPPPAAAQQPNGGAPQGRPPVMCTNGGADCQPGSIHSSHN